MILVVDHLTPTIFERVESGTFQNLNIWERKHIQEWIRQAPEILGEELLVVSFEFDRFEQTSDRLDILAIDVRGNLVVIELKRDSFAGHADLQAIRYAAMVSSMTVSDLLPYYRDYCKRYLGQLGLTTDEAHNQIRAFVEDESFSELSSQPRIILCSEDFSPELTNTVLWLNKVGMSGGLSITCVRIKPHKVGNQIVIVPSRLIPLPEASQYLINVQRKEDQQEEQRRKNRAHTMSIILENKVLQGGELLLLKSALPAYVQFVENDSRFRAQIISADTKQVKWEHDGQQYPISALTRKVFQLFKPSFSRTPNGNAHWTNADGISLWQLAEDFLRTQHEVTT